MAEQAQAGAAGPLEQGLDRIAACIVEVLETAIELLGVEIDDDDAAAIDPLAYALVGAVFGAVRRWVGQSPRRPAADHLSSMLSTRCGTSSTARRGGSASRSTPTSRWRSCSSPRRRGGDRMSAAEEGAREVQQDGVGEPDELDRLWTPHRMAYIRGENKPSDATGGECPFCRIPTLDDDGGLVVHRGDLAFAVLNLYPYAPGHLMVCPYRHIADYTETTDEEAAEIADLTRSAMRVRPRGLRRRRASTSG